MAGRARLQALKDELETRTLDYFDVDPIDIATGAAPMPSHLDYVCARVEDGCTTKALCKELTSPLGYELTYDRLMRYLRDLFGAESVAQALDAARIRASHCLADEALAIVDAPAYDSVTVQQARARANQRNWLAERYNRKAYGAQKDVSVSVTVGSLHLMALRAAPSIVTVTDQAQLGAGEAASPNTSQVVDAEVVS